MINSSTGGTQMRRNRPCWKFLTPTVLLSVVILAMAPSFYGFDLVRVPMGTSSSNGGLAWARSEVGFGAGAAASGGLGAGGGDGTQQEVVNKRSPFTAASWFKERVRDGKRRIHMQVRRGLLWRPCYWFDYSPVIASSSNRWEHIWRGRLCRAVTARRFCALGYYSSI